MNEMGETAQALEAPGGDRAVTRALVRAFVSVALLAIFVCAVLMVMLVRVGNALDEVREDGRAVQEGLGLALSVREHYVHEANTVIRGDQQQLAPHLAWIDELRADVDELRPRVPATEQSRLDDMLEVSEDLDEAFIEDVLPAALAGDRARLRAAHHRAEHLTDEATRDADALVLALDERMDRARRDAEQASTVALATGCLGLGAMFLMVLGFSVRIRSSIVTPMHILADAARRLGDGEQIAALSPLGRGEIATVARAFDAMARDIRERETKLVESEKMAAIGQLAAGVAHEINNPVGIIRGYLRTMLAEAASDATREELQILDEEAEACQRIVEDLLTFAAAPHLERRPVAVHKLLEEVGQRLGKALGAGAFEVHAAPATIAVDPVRIRQVVTNLLKNAHEASPRGDVVELTGELDDDVYRLTVFDRGDGIPEEELAQIFEPFHSTKSRGSGLGLAVCRSIALAHGGSITAALREGGGTAVTVALPLESGEESST